MCLNYSGFNIKYLNNSYNIKDAYYILLTLLNCSFLLSLGSDGWVYRKTIAFIIIMTGLQLLNKKFWFTTFISFIPFYLIYIPNFPRLTNHGNLQVFVGILIICFVFTKLEKIRNNKINTQTISTIFTYSLITIYFIAGFHKLNYDFFEVNNSCINYISKNFNALLFGETYNLPTPLITFSQFLTIFFEMIVPVGLLFSKTRKFSTWLLIGFHFYMSLCSFSNFSAFAGFLICGSIISFENHQNYYVSIIKALRFYVFFAIVSVISSYFINRYGLLDRNYTRVYNGIIFNIGWLIFFYNLIRKTPLNETKKPINKVSIICSVFLLLWGAQPYFGLSNSGNLTMFSNLITLKEKNNHYLIDTKKSKIWNFEEDLITIVKIPDFIKWENSISLNDSQIPLIEFKTQAQKWIKKYSKKISITIKYNNKIIRIDDLKESEYFKDNKWWYHYIYFRKISNIKTNECLW